LLRAFVGEWDRVGESMDGLVHGRVNAEAPPWPARPPRPLPAPSSPPLLLAIMVLHHSRHHFAHFLCGKKVLLEMVDPLIPMLNEHDRPDGGDIFYLPGTVILELEYYQDRQLW
jgi:hypothetical protein